MSENKPRTILAVGAHPDEAAAVDADAIAQPGGEAGHGGAQVEAGLVEWGS